MDASPAAYPCTARVLQPAVRYHGDMDDKMTQILVVVHPGSACGSANFNLGRSLADGSRDVLADEINTWRGGIVIIHGSLSDELPGYPRLKEALDGALERTRVEHLPSVEISGDDEADINQVAAIRQWAKGKPWRMAPVFTVTGAWYHPEDGGGCVGSVVDELRRLGHPAEVSDSAVCLDWNADEPEAAWAGETDASKSVRGHREGTTARRMRR